MALNVAPGRRTAAQTARLCQVCEATVSRILAAARAGRTTPEPATGPRLP